MAQNTFQAQSAPLTDTTNANQLENAYNQVQTSLGQQQNFVNALQSSGAQGLNAQQQLTQQLLNRSVGAGPNPALDQLNQTTGQNVANQAALMASQRGTNANAGLLARQAAQQGAATQQQAVGQAATLNAQQQIAAQQQLGQQATQQVGQQQTGITGLTGANQTSQNQLLNAAGNLNNANVSNTSNQNNVNSGVAAQNTSTTNNAIGGALSGVGAVMGLARGGKVPQVVRSPASEAPIQKPVSNGVKLPGTTQDKKKIQDSFNNAMGFAQGGAISGLASGFGDDKNPFTKGASQFGAGLRKQLIGGTSVNTVDTSALDSGGKEDGILSDAPALLPEGSMFASHGAMVPESKEGEPRSHLARNTRMVVGEILASHGATVPGKAKHKGDTLKNDTVPAMLSPGEIVIPRSHSMDPDKAAAFARAIVMRNRKK